MILLLILVAVAILIGQIWLLVVAFRVNVGWGFVVLLVPFGALVFIGTHWSAAKAPFLFSLLSGAVLGGALGANPEFIQAFKHRQEVVAARKANTDGSPRGAHDLAIIATPVAARPTVPTVAPVDPLAAKRAAYLQHSAELNAEFQRLNAERTALKPGDKAALAVFNTKAGHYQRGLLVLAAERAQVEASGRPTGPAPTATGLDAEANAALARLRSSVEQGDYAAFASGLKKCLADYRQTTAFPQIAAFARQAMRNAPPAQLSSAVLQRGRIARMEYDATAQKVLAIVNQVPTPLPTKPHSQEIYQTGYHPGSTKPDFNTADVLSGREPYKGDYIYIDTNPGIYYRSADCEFNSQTKFFYTRRDVPKKKLTDAENLEIVRLYRILGQDEAILNALPKRLEEAKNTSADLVALYTQLGAG